MCLSFLLFVHATSVGQPACDAVRRTGIDAHDGVDGAAHPAHPPVSGLFGVAPNTLPGLALTGQRQLATSQLSLFHVGTPCRPVLRWLARASGRKILAKASCLDAVPGCSAQLRKRRSARETSLFIAYLLAAGELASVLLVRACRLQRLARCSTARRRARTSDKNGGPTGESPLQGRQRARWS